MILSSEKSKLKLPESPNQAASECAWTGISIRFCFLSLLSVFDSWFGSVVTWNVFGVTGVIGIVFGQVGLSQDLGVSPSSQDKVSDLIRPGVLPDIILMRNEAGEEILVPKVRYEDFEKFLQQQAASQTAAGNKENLDRIEIGISVENNVAKLRVEAETRLRETSSRWKSIPIGLGLTQIVPTVSMVESEPQFPSIRMSNENSGYEWLIAPGEERSRRLSFESLCNVQTNGQTQSIRLDLPMSPSIVKLNLPRAQWDLTVTGSGSEVVEPFREVQSMSQALVRASGGTIVLSWSKKTAQERVQAIEVLSQTKFLPALDSTVFRASSSMVMRGPKSLGGRRFLITLPKNCQWLSPASSVVPIQGVRISKSESNSAEESTVLILDFEESFSRMETELAIEWQQSGLGENQSASFAIPKMEGVERHVGGMEVVVPKAIRFVWEPQPGILFLKQTGEAGDATSYEFRFEQQTTPLVASWISSDQRTSFNASYEIIQDQDTIRLVGSIQFVELVRAFPFFQFDTKGWVVDRLQVLPSGKLIDINSNRTNPTAASIAGAEIKSSISLSLSDLLPLASAPSSPSTGAMPENPKLVSPNDSVSDAIRGAANRGQEPDAGLGSPLGISFVLSRPFPLKTGDRGIPFQFSLPLLSWLDSQSQLRKSLCPQGELLIRSSFSHLQLDFEKSIGLSKMPLDWSDKSKPGSVADGRVRRFQMNGTETWAELVGSAEQASAVISASADTTLLLSQDALEMSQSWELKVQGPVPKSFLFSVPGSKVAEGSNVGPSVQFFLDGSSVSSEPSEIDKELPLSAAQRDIPAEHVLVRVIVPDRLREWKATDSVMDVKVMTKTMRSAELQANTFDFQYPLPMLFLEGGSDYLSIQRYAGEVRFPSNMLVKMAKPLSSSILKATEVVDGLRVIPFDCTGEKPLVSGSILVDQGQRDRSIKVESAWLQSISNAVERRERLVLRFQTLANSIGLKLPADRRSNSKVILNGSKAKVVEDQQNPDRLEILLPSSPSNATGTDPEFVLEIFTWPTAHAEWVVSLQPDLPTIEDSKYDFPILWQIVVPATSHLVGSSKGLSPGYSWSWRDLWSNRLSDLDQVGLEKQMGATSQPIVSQNTNQYLFYGLTQRSPMQVWLAPRYLLWVPVALCMLLGTIAVLEMRWLQRPWLGMLVLAVCLGFIMWDWDFAAAIVQCMILAIGVAFMYCGLTWLLDRQTRRRTIFANRAIPSAAGSLSGNAVLSGSSPKIQTPSGAAHDSRRHVVQAELPAPVQVRPASSATTTAPAVLGNPGEAN